MRETKKTKTIIAGLKSNTHYQFQVTATNDLTKSEPTTQSLCTQQSKAFVGATGGVVGTVFSPVLLWGFFGSDEYCKEGVAKSAATSMAFIPVSFLCAPVVAPVAAVRCARVSRNNATVETCLRRVMMR